MQHNTSQHNAMLHNAMQHNRHNTTELTSTQQNRKSKARTYAKQTSRGSVKLDPTQAAQAKVESRAQIRPPSPRHAQ